VRAGSREEIVRAGSFAAREEPCDTRTCCGTQDMARCARMMARATTLPCAVCVWRGPERNGTTALYLCISMEEEGVENKKEVEGMEREGERGERREREEREESRGREGEGERRGERGRER
jgi:hypothetical protein